MPSSLLTLAAHTLGFGRLSCALCSRRFSGLRWRDINGHTAHVPPALHGGTVLTVRGRALCPRCTRAGAGCRAWNGIRVNAHPGCPAVDSTPAGDGP